MRKLIIPVLLLFGLLLIQAQECINLEAFDINGNTDINIDCNYPFVNNECFTLQANFTETSAATSYIVDSIGFNSAISVNSGSPVNINVPDDTWGEVIDLPFPFCYFGNTFNQIVIADNGLVSFNTSYSGTSCVFTAASLPNTSLYRNTIYALYHDLTNDDSVIGCDDNPNTATNECGEILIRTIGNYPCRQFVVNFNSINHFGCTNVKSSFQLILYEGTNEIEVNVYSKPENCESPSPLTNYRKKATIGILNASGNNAYFPAYRNANEFVISDKTYRFIPNGAPNYQINWLNEAGDVIGNNSQLTICEVIPQIYTAQVTYDQCGAEPIVLTEEISIEIDPNFPIANDLEVNMCDQNLDQVETVNLTDYYNQITSTPSNFSISFFTSFANAENNFNPITNANNYQINSNSTVYARVALNSGCFQIAEIVFQLINAPTINSQTFDICDTDNDGTESIDLTDYTDDLVVDAESFEISYFASNQNAIDNINPLTNITLTGNATYWIRVALEDCINIQSFQFTLLPKPEVNDISLELCPNNYYDLEQHQSEILGTTTNVTVSYHRNINQAKLNTNPLDAQNLLINNNAYYVRVEDNTTGCYSIAVINVEFIEDDPLLDAILIHCVPEDVIIDYFNLTDALSQMTLNPDNYEIRYFENQNDAFNDNIDTEILDPDITNHEGEAPNRTVFVRFTNNLTGCMVVKKIKLVITEFPQILDDYLFACQLENSTEDVIVDLHTYDEMIIGNNTENPNNSVFHVQYFETEDDAINIENQINEYPVTGTHQLYVRIVVGIPLLDENLEPVFDEDENPVYLESCFAVFPITIELTEISDIVESPIDICNNFNDNFETLTLSDYTGYYTSNPDYSNFKYLRYNLNQTSPINSNVLISEPYFYLEFLNESNCKIRVKYPINFINAPDFESSVLEICDAGQDGTETVYLMDYANQFISPVSDYSFGFYTNLNGAKNENQTYLINNTDNYTITNSTPTIYVRITSNDTGCANVSAIDFQFQPIPDFSPDIYICDSGSNTSYSNYTLSNFDNQILENYTAYEFHYFQTSADASNQTNELTIADVFDNQTWYVLIISNLGCSYIAETVLHFFNIPTLTSNIELCNDNGGNDEEILVGELNSLIVSNSDLYEFTYYNSQNDLDNHENAIDPAIPITIENGSQLFAEVKFNVGCTSASVINISFLPSPEVFPIEYIVCDLDNNLQENFDITSKNNLLCPNYSQYIISYYENSLGANSQDASAQITSNLTNYFADQEYTEIYVRFENPDTGCYSVAQLTLHISPIPKLLNASYSACDEGLNGENNIDLTQLNPLILEENQSDGSLSYTYFLNYSDAFSNTNAIINPSQYSIASSNFDIFIRVENENGCFSLAEVNVTIGTKAPINSLNNTVDICDENDDMSETIDLAQFQEEISTSADAFEYFSSLSDMQSETNEISNPFNYEATNASTTIYIRVKEEGYCDNYTSFDINLLPVPVSNHQSEYFICEGEETEISVQPGYASYFWPQLDATTPNVVISEPGEYQVIITDIEGCTAEYVITVEASPDPFLSIEQISANSVQINYDTTQGVLLFSLDGENFSENNIFSNLESGTYTVYMKWEGSECIYSEEFYLLVITNVITPNGDGYNDEWIIDDSTFFSEGKASLKIYDRYSKVVYSQVSDNSLIWDGKYLGRNVPTETYWYTLTDTKGKEYRGWIFVKNTVTD